MACLEAILCPDVSCNGLESLMRDNITAMANLLTDIILSDTTRRINRQRQMNKYSWGEGRGVEMGGKRGGEERKKRGMYGTFNHDI